MRTLSDGSVSCILGVKYGVPAALVERMLRSERELLSREARVTRYIPILAQRRLEERLRVGGRRQPADFPQPESPLSGSA